jgi:alpha-glucosidase
VWVIPNAAESTPNTGPAKSAIVRLDPPEQDFFSKKLDFHGIPIKAHAVVSDEALYAARARLSTMLQHLPDLVTNLVAAKVALHIIGKDQVTTDLPEWQHDKGKRLREYNGLTRDQRTRGMGGRLVSCGEENLLKLEKDRYRGRDICVHEFAHAVRNLGMSRELHEQFDAQYRRSLGKGLWVKGYAASNPDEFFAELTMWYFGTHGDLNMNEPKPRDGPEGLKEYDPEAFTLFDDFYQGRMALAQQTRGPLQHAP